MTKQILQRCLLIVILYMTSVVSGYCDQQSQPKPQEPKDGEGRLEKIKSGSIRKRIPSREFLEIYYDNGFISIQSETCQGSFSLEMSCDSSMRSYGVPAITIGESLSFEIECGEYEVTAVRSDGTTFKGLLLIQ